MYLFLPIKPEGFNLKFFPPANSVGTSNEVCSSKIERLEVVASEAGGAIDGDEEPDEVEYERHTGNAVIAIWPKMETVQIAVGLGLSVLLEILETGLAERDSDFITLLHETLAYCKKDIGYVFSRYQFPDRLLEVCVAGGALEDVLCALRLLSEPFLCEAQPASERAIPTTVGIVNADSVAQIVKAVQKHGWKECGTYVMGLLKKPHVARQGKFFGQLAFELEKLGIYDVALLVAKRTLELVLSVSLGQLEAELLCDMAKLIFSFKECLNEFGIRFVNMLVEVDTPVLCSLVTEVDAFLSDNKHVVLHEFCRDDGEHGDSLFTRLCEMVIGKDFHRFKGSEDYVVDLVQVFHSLGIDHLFDKLIRAFVDQSRLYNQQHLLRTLLDADTIWTQFSGSTMGQRGLQSLATTLNRQLLAKIEPEFSWCMPFAKFPGHPLVEEFLQGPQAGFLYRAFDDEPHARSFAGKYFTGSYRDGYSATATCGGRGEGAYCSIRKTRDAFQHSVCSWEQEQEALSRLRIRSRNLRRVLTRASWSYQNEVVVLSLIQAQMTRNKRSNIPV